MSKTIDYEELDKIFGITEEDRKEIRENPPTYSTKDFYEMLENINPKSLPAHVQLSELMRENGVEEGHPMYEELIEDINSAVNDKLKKRKARGWTHPQYTIPITREEYVVDFCMMLEFQGDKVIPDEYKHLKEKFRYNH
ncbi:hypothetical protein [Cytobacillus firmus]|uniref:hypothetical protein n=1 Tax=Cytobacillus firmus TaxID=1399 RepID=UPI0018CD0F61|nr:hypothetical protein [Cytobacillus firmus]MBG9589823.1 hypothetical protein [Cytobacillus firmus]